MQMLLGVLLLVGGYSLARLLDLVLIRTLMETVFQYGAIAALVVFQPELRSALARLGQSRMVAGLFSRLEESHVVEAVVAGVEQLSRSKVGAIIAKGELGEAGIVGVICFRIMTKGVIELWPS